MQTQTLEVVKAALKSDSSIPPKERGEIIARIRNPTPVQVETDRIVRRREAALLLGRSKRSVDSLGAAGVLNRIRMPGRSRGGGYRLSEIRRLIEGNL